MGRHVTARLAGVLALCALSTSCALYYRAGIGLLYEKVDLPPAQVQRDIPYAGPASDAKQRLNLFLPGGRDFPFVVFVHGGSWNEGDRNLEVGGADIYNNIGRYLASQGIGAAVAGYRLLPGVSWRAQIDDVAAAVRWMGRHAQEFGGSSRCVFVMGHSAGAQLAVRVAVDPSLRAAGGEPMPAICGVIGVSGAGYDLADQRTYDLGHDPGFYAQRFGGTAGWQLAASPIRFVTPPGARLPPFLLLYAGGETKSLQRQSQLLQERLLQAGAASSLLVVPGESHTRIVLALSRSDKTAGPAVVRFVHRTAGASK